MKRAKTTVGKPRRKSPLKRHGTESNKDIFEFHEDSDGDLGNSTWNLDGPRSGQSTRVSSNGSTVTLETTDRSEVHRVGGDEHRSSSTSMPPPSIKPSSYEQTQVLETTWVPTMQNPIASSPGIQYESTEKTGSLDPTHSGSRMPTPTMSSRQDESNYTQDTDVVQFPLQPPLLGSDAARIDNDGPSSSAIELSPSKNTTLLAEEHGSKALTAIGETSDDYTSSLVVIADDIPETIDPIVLLPGNTHSSKGDHDLSLPSHGPETWSINQTTLSKAPKRNGENNISQNDELGSDDITIGLPKGQYQPRPSKSRSGRGAEGIFMPADFSKKPEALAKKKKTSFKRRKTTAFHELMLKDDDGEDDELSMLHEDKIPRTASPPSMPEKSEQPELEKVQADNTEPVVLDPNPSAKPAVAKKRKGRPRKEPVPALVEGTTNYVGEDKPTAPDVYSSKPKEEDVGKRMTKKGTKGTPVPVVICEEEHQDSDGEFPGVDELIRAPGQPLDEASGNRVLSKHEEKSGSSPLPPKAVASPPKTPTKTCLSPEKGPDKHSPISSGKVAYRVGLSKRARIAPLLRVVRKA